MTANRYGIFVGEGDEHILELDCGDVCTSVMILKTNELYTLNGGLYDK